MTTSTRSTGQQRRSVRTREHILGAALASFALKGYPETSMEDICRDSGCSKGGVYHHFRTKDAVLLSTIGRLSRFGSLNPPVGHLAAATGLPEPGLGRLLLDFWAEASRSAEVREILAGKAMEPADPPLVALLRVGALVQSLALGQSEADDAQERLGIPRAA